MSNVSNPASRDDRINDSDDYRDGYVEGYLDAIAAVRNIDRETVAALAGLADRRDSLTDAEREEIKAAAQSPAARLLDETAARWNREHQQWRAQVLGCPEWCNAVHMVDEAPGFLHQRYAG